MTTLVAWLLHHSKDVLPIPGTSKLDHLEENVGGGTLVLDDDQMQRLDELAPASEAAR